ncbi:MAG: alpha/beta hydrolase [Chloroflexota bacterium]|nr:alpha/beta hydrolase [Chloroflexota bacterium]
MPYARVGDADLYYDEFGAGAPVLIVHGMLTTGRNHARLALTLSSSYRVVVPDLRGYGRSGPRPRHYPPDFYARDAADLVGLLAHLGLTGVRIIGFGDGAEVALLLALAAPERVRAVLAVDVSGAFTADLLDILPRLGVWSETGSTNNLPRRVEAFRDYGQAGTAAMWREWRAAVAAIIAAGGDISRSRGAEITCPVLLINGADDSVNPADQSWALAAAIPGAELRLVPDVGQLVYNRQDRTLTDLAVAWFADH